MKIEIICPDKDVDKIIEVIKNNAHTGRRGDGKIFVYDSIEKAISIRTYEEGDNAI